MDQLTEYGSILSEQETGQDHVTKIAIVVRIVVELFVINNNNNNARETQFLFQRLSVILQRFNAVLFGESFLAASDDTDM